MQRSPRTIAAALLVLTACSLPRDPEGTLARVRGGVLRAGAVHQPPEVDASSDAPGGREVVLVESLADSLGAELRWSIGGETHLMDQLERFELDLVVGDLDREGPYAERVGMVQPDPDGPVLAAPPGENAWMMALESFLRERGLQ